jgi:hypothetical protein
MLADPASPWIREEAVAVFFLIRRLVRYIKARRNRT